MAKSDEFQISQIPNLEGYVVIVTGGNAGVGYETSLQLAKRGARVYIASRSKARVEDAISKMRTQKGVQDVRFLKLDLQDLQGVKAAAAEFMEKESRLDILINNAGIMASPYELTKDGYETQWQTCFLGHHAFTLSLLPLMLKTAKETPENKGRVRIVNVASDAAMVFGPKEGIHYDDPNMTNVTGTTAPWKRYGQCKQASILAAMAITERYQAQGITAYSLHPGIIKTNLQSHGPGILGALSRFGMKVFPTISALDGSRTSLYCATSPEAPKMAGHFFVPYGKLDNRPNKWLKDPKTVKKLWDLADKQLTKNGFAFDL